MKTSGLRARRSSISHALGVLKTFEKQDRLEVAGRYALRVGKPAEGRVAEHVAATMEARRVLDGHLYCESVGVKRKILVGAKLDLTERERDGRGGHVHGATLAKLLVGLRGEPNSVVEPRHRLIERFDAVRHGLGSGAVRSVDAHVVGEHLAARNGEEPRVGPLHLRGRGRSSVGQCACARAAGRAVGPMGTRPAVHTLYAISAVISIVELAVWKLSESGEWRGSQRLSCRPAPLLSWGTATPRSRASRKAARRNWMCSVPWPELCPTSAQARISRRCLRSCSLRGHARSRGCCTRRRTRRCCSRRRPTRSPLETAGDRTQWTVDPQCWPGGWCRRHAAPRMPRAWPGCDLCTPVRNRRRRAARRFPSSCTRRCPACHMGRPAFAHRRDQGQGERPHRT
eukprot:scaffold291083_cov28-Tisochrysis_lutea.AAC.2